MTIIKKDDRVVLNPDMNIDEVIYELENYSTNRPAKDLIMSGMPQTVLQTSSSGGGVIFREGGNYVPKKILIHYNSTLEEGEEL